MVLIFRSFRKCCFQCKKFVCLHPIDKISKSGRLATELSCLMNRRLSCCLLPRCTPCNEKRGNFVLVMGVNAIHRKESGYPLRDFASRPDRAYKLEIQIMACLFQDLQIGNTDNCLSHPEHFQESV